MFWTHFQTSSPAGKVHKSVLIISAVALVLFMFDIWVTRAPDAALSSMPANITSVVQSVASSTAAITGATSTPSITAPPPPKPQQVGHVVGIAAGGGLSKLSAADMNAALDQIVALGATWVRFDIEWGDVQYSSPDTSTWQSYDALVNAIAAHHLNGLGVIVFTPEWARAAGCSGGAKCPPKDPNQYATFAAQVVARYKDKGVHAWEIWNEPNSYDFWATKTDCDAYTALLKATYPAIKKADPTATVVTGGLTPAATDNHNISPIDFLSCIYRDGGKDYFDAVGDHPYSYPALPSNASAGAWGQMSITQPSLRGIMTQNGDIGKKIWITEFGTPTNGPDSHWFVSEDTQAKMVTDAINLYKSYPWAGPLFWYTLKDGGVTTDTNENFFGLIRADNSPKPAFATLKNIISSGL